MVGIWFGVDISLFSVIILNSLNITEKLKLFDSMVLPTLNYGCEIWGFYPAPNVEAVHLNFLKQLLKVRSQTNSAMVYGELGRVPLIIKRKERILRYSLNPCPAEPGYILFCKQCRSRSVGF